MPDQSAANSGDSAKADGLFPKLPRRIRRFAAQLTRDYAADLGEILASSNTLLDRLTHHVHILVMNGESYRLKTSKQKRAAHRTQ